MSSVVASKTVNTVASTKELLQMAKEKLDLVDFKMVTFSLAGKDYGIDIMRIKEIARFVNFTYVPNTPNFVRGVYNLRGDIISIIDMRAMFNLPYKQKAVNEEEAGLIIRLQTTLIGIVVDKIDKVVGINSKNIQPPHPIFGDINIKYISGVVENDGRLYIILDVEKVLGKSEEKENEVNVDRTEAVSLASKISDEPDIRVTGDRSSGNERDQNRGFIRESLQALAGFTANSINETWFGQRFQEWESSRKGNQVQIKSLDEARQFLEGFYSPYTGQLWSQEYIEAFKTCLPDQLGPHINVWNPGCGRGYETYSIAIALRQKYPEARIKIWASDKDLLNISSAPNLVFAEREIPNCYDEFMVDGKNGKAFNQKIKEIILFEYHDMINEHNLPPLDLVLCRDVISFQTELAQKSIMQTLGELVKHHGLVILGKNESLFIDGQWSIKEYELMRVAQHE